MVGKQTRVGLAALLLVALAALIFAVSHLNVGPFNEQDFSIIDTHADLRIDHAKGRVEVADVRAGPAAAKAGVLPGWRLLSVDGLRAGEAARVRFRPVLKQPRPIQLSYGITIAANGRRGKARRLVLRRSDGSLTKLELPSPSERARDITSGSVLSVNRLGENHRSGHIVITNPLGNNQTIAASGAALVQHTGTNGKDPLLADAIRNLGQIFEQRATDQLRRSGLTNFEGRG